MLARGFVSRFWLRRSDYLFWLRLSYLFFNNILRACWLTVLSRSRLSLFFILLGFAIFILDYLCLHWFLINIIPFFSWLSILCHATFTLRSFSMWFTSCRFRLLSTNSTWCFSSIILFDIINMFFFTILFWMLHLPCCQIKFILLKSFLILNLVLFLLSIIKFLPVICSPLWKSCLRFFRIILFKFFDRGEFIKEKGTLRLNGLIMIPEMNFGSSLFVWTHGCSTTLLVCWVGFFCEFLVYFFVIFFEFES